MNIHYEYLGDVIDCKKTVKKVELSVNDSVIAETKGSLIDMKTIELEGSYQGKDGASHTIKFRNDPDVFANHYSIVVDGQTVYQDKNVL